MRGPNLWASSAIFGLAVLALTKLSAPVNHVGVSRQFAPTQTIWPSVVNNVTYYGLDLWKQFGLVVGAWLLLSTCAFVLVPSLRRRHESQLYLAWILALAPVLLPAANRDVRYFLFGMPALIVLGYDGLALALKRVLPLQFVPTLVGLVAVCVASYLLAGFLRHNFRSTAHREAALALKDRAPRRLLYCGEKPTFLAWAMRVENPDSKTVMFRADKLDPVIFTPEAFEQFAWRYGVDTVVVEPGRKPHLWDFLFDHPTKSMVCARLIEGGWQNRSKFQIFEFTNPSSTPDSTLNVPISSTDGGMILEF